MLTRSMSMRFTASEVLRHPWISFYTDPTLKTLNPISKNHMRLPTSRHLTCTHVPELERKGVIIPRNTLSDLYIAALTVTIDVDVEEEDGGLVDVLTSAISRVRISEPKRSRICSPSRPVEESPSNLTSSNLCAAF